MPTGRNLQRTLHGAFAGEFAPAAAFKGPAVLRFGYKPHADPVRLVRDLPALAGEGLDGRRGEPVIPRARRHAELCRSWSQPQGGGFGLTHRPDAVDRCYRKQRSRDQRSGTQTGHGVAGPAAKHRRDVETAAGRQVAAQP